MSFKDVILNLLLDNVAVPRDVIHTIVDNADTNGDGMITLRELYENYRRWKHGD